MFLLERIGLSGMLSRRKEQDTKTALVRAFFHKAVHDLGLHGFIVERISYGDNGYVDRISNSTVSLRGIGKNYTVTLTTICSKPGEPRPHISRMKVDLMVEDDIDLPNTPGGERRNGSIYKEIYPPSPDDPNQDTHFETGNAFFFRTVNNAVEGGVVGKTSPIRGRDLSIADINSFLEEVLNADVDIEKTQEAFVDAHARRSSMIGVVNSISWCRENPNSFFQFFQD